MQASTLSYTTCDPEEPLPGPVPMTSQSVSAAGAVNRSLTTQCPFGSLGRHANLWTSKVSVYMGPVDTDAPDTGSLLSFSYAAAAPNLSVPLYETKTILVNLFWTIEKEAQF